jgi:hypothetical protein
MFGSNETRRAILTKIVATAASTAGVAGAIAFLSDDDPSPQPQDTKDHYIQFSVGPGEGTPGYRVSVPDADPVFVNLETLSNQDDVTKYPDHTEVDGQLKGNAAPYEDEIEFDGSLNDSDFHWSASGGIQVIIDDEVKQEG